MQYYTRISLKDFFICPCILLIPPSPTEVPLTNVGLSSVIPKCTTLSKITEIQKPHTWLLDQSVKQYSEPFPLLAAGSQNGSTGEPGQPLLPNKPSCDISLCL